MIDLRSILAKQGERFGNMYDNKPEFRDALQEIIDATVDECKDAVKIEKGCDWDSGGEAYTTYEIDYNSIEEVKKMVVK